jgi:predicted RNA-binding protein Jag
MGRSIIAKGATIKEAINTALDILDAMKDQVDIEIIEKESKGWLGIGSKPAVIRATFRNSSSDNNKPEIKQPADILNGLINDFRVSENVDDYDNNQLLKTSYQPFATKPMDLDGKVWVNDGQIFCKNAPSKYPLITPGKGMKLYCNDELVENTIVVDEYDNLKVELEDEVIEPLWKLKMDDSMMSITLTVTPGMRIYRKLLDHKPDTNIQLKIMESNEACPIEMKQVLEKLKEMKGAVGVNYSEIANACQGGVKGDFLIASGVKPVPGKNGYFMSFKELSIIKGVKERLDGTVDHREIQEFPSVDHGQVIGVIHPEIPGKPGTSVIGEPVMPPEVYPLVVQAGNGVALVENGTKVIATEAGQPQIITKKQLAKISVVPKLIIGKDVTLETGNVRFIGDVEIHGSVQDGMLIDANGSVLVRENINMAQVIAGGSVIVHHNIISSEVTAGKNTKLLWEMNLWIGEIALQIKQMVIAIQQLGEVSAFKITSITQTGLGSLIKILCDGKFKSLLKQIKSLVNVINNEKGVLDQEWTDLADRLIGAFMTPASSVIRSVEDIIQLIRDLEDMQENNNISTGDTNCIMIVAFAHNSQLYSAGDLIIVGQGCYNSKLYAGGYIQIDGYVRGGEIYASKGIKIKEAGTKGGTATKITVPKDQTIEIQRAMEDTVIQIGLKTHKFDKETTFVSARLNEDGHIYFQ